MLQKPQDSCIREKGLLITAQKTVYVTSYHRNAYGPDGCHPLSGFATVNLGICCFYSEEWANLPCVHCLISLGDQLQNDPEKHKKGGKSVNLALSGKSSEDQLCHLVGLWSWISKSLGACVSASVRWASWLNVLLGWGLNEKTKSAHTKCWTS